ncbi:uncharacterized protein LOC126424806 isoform X2 [Schistocerca serialis cubense]|uniref:uncharacterized protein LOC126424806 isoform X2 n=1 Tax=Schistocerca serialis cubense TaxID=2023355 RepID=UPI00214EF24A|nr:uncharacterized protein LOC126424806 isoform X2 [Schistocerca serialis cubense]
MPQCVKQPTGDLINHTLCVKSWLTLQCDPGVLPLSFRVQLFGANRVCYSCWLTSKSDCHINDAGCGIGIANGRVCLRTRLW